MSFFVAIPDMLSQVPWLVAKHLVQALPLVFTLQCLTGKADKNKNDINHHSTNESHNSYFVTNGNQ